MRTLRLVLGSVIVYLFVACASAISGDSPVVTSLDGSAPSSDAPTGPDDSTTPSGTSSSPKESGTIGAIVDALTDPVSSASAQTMTSGSRLKAKWYVGADGSKQFLGWHDSQLNTDCDFGVASDGATRCIPAYPAGALVATYFADAACSQPIAYLYPGCATPTYASQSASASCALKPVTQIFSIAGVYGGTVYQGTSSSCTAVTATTILSLYTFYSIGTESPPSQFVQATVQTDQ
jgi:hypothetical protein